MKAIENFAELVAYLAGGIEPKREEHNRAKLSEPGYSMRQTKAAVGIFLPQPLLFF